MTTVVNTPLQETPQIEPLVSTLLDHATIAEGFAWVSERSLSDSYNCLDMAVETELCPDPSSPKNFEAPGWNEGIRFAVYGGVVCKPFSFDVDKGEAEVKRVFQLRESLGVERALMDKRFILGPDDDPGVGVDSRWPAPTDITPATAPSAKVGLALLEGYAGSVYAGVPTLHIPRTIGSLLLTENAGIVTAGKAYTHSGSKMALGAGYEYPNHGPDGTDPAAGTQWMYATGEVMVARGGVLAKAVLDTNTNDILALAERPYVVAVDCFVAAIRVKVE